MSNEQSENDKFPAIDPRVRISHVHLKVADLERSLNFYCGVLGFQLTQRYGDSAAFISAGGYHHHIALNTWESRNAPRRRRGQRDFIIWRSFTPHARRWRRRCAG